MEIELLTLPMLARRLKPLGITLAWLRSEADAGRIPCLKVSRGYLFEPNAVAQAITRLAANGDGKEVREAVPHA